MTNSRRSAAALLIVAASFLGAVAARAEAADKISRIAVISAFDTELALLRAETEDASNETVNGITFTTGRLEGHDVVLFLSGISVVNAAMTTQLALDRFAVKRIVFSGIAGGVDPALNIGDVVVAERWGQYLEAVLARKTADGWRPPPFFTYPYANYGMWFPRAMTVQRDGAAEPETRFWFPADAAMLATARSAADRLDLQRCTPSARCLRAQPKIVIGGNGVSGGAFVDNAAFRAYTYDTFEAKVLDMESAAVAHVAYANGVPFIAFRSLSDLAGGSPGENGAENEIETFFQLAATNAAAVVRAFLAALTP